MTMTSPPAFSHHGATDEGTVVRRPRTTQLAVAGALTILALGFGVSFPRFATAAYPPSAAGQHYAASTDHADATRAALDVMAAGGNAADGAIAAALTLGVVNSFASGIGGGSFALVYTASDRKVTALDFRESAPAGIKAELLWPKRPNPGVGEGPSPSVSRWTFSGLNGNVVGVPGEPAGLELLSRRFGKKSLAVAAAPAVALAQNGFLVGSHLAEQIGWNRDRLEAAPRLTSTFLPGGSAAGFGTRVRRPELAATLARFGAEGKRSIYEGATAQKIVDALKATGGTMTLADLAGYQVRERTPLSKSIEGRTIYSMPAPSAGGLTLLEVTGMYGASSKSELAALGLGSSGYIHMVAEALRGSFADRARVAGDPDAEKGADAAYQRALDPAQLAARRGKIDPNKTHPPTAFKTSERGTSHLVVADSDGNVVSLTTTVNGAFGSSIVAGDSGILLNNELEDFAHPDDIKPYVLAETSSTGPFKDGGPNRPRPGARPVSSMTPTIVLENGLPILAAGGSGGTHIATGVTQAALARLVFDQPPSVCVSAPRFHAQGVDLLVDPDTPRDVREGLVRRGETVKDDPFTTSAVQMIAWERPAGGPARILAASDPRKHGMSAAR
jgi:gamma-glutamyltranspeptidase / glutathione hydrolase